MTSRLVLDGSMRSVTRSLCISRIENYLPDIRGSLRTRLRIFSRSEPRNPFESRCAGVGFQIEVGRGRLDAVQCLVFIVECLVVGV